MKHSHMSEHMFGVLFHCRHTLTWDPDAYASGSPFIKEWTMKQGLLLRTLEKEIAEQTKECEASHWCNDEDGMWMMGRLNGLKFARNLIKPEIVWKVKDET